MGSLHSLMGRREYGTGPVRAAESLIASLRADSYIIKSYDIYGVNKYRSKEDNNNIGTVYIKGYGKHIIISRMIPGGCYEAVLAPESTIY